jgi:hypothetical protein
MRMPQDFVDAVNNAVHDVNPNAGMMVSGSITLGHDFDEWVGPQAMAKYGIGPLPPEALRAFAAKFDEHREALKEAIVSSAVRAEAERMKSRG